MVLKKQIELGKGLNCQLEFPDLNLQSNVDIDLLKHLLEANMVTLMQKIITSELKRKKKANKIWRYGHLPKMSLASKGSTGALLASMFCEQINSVANKILTNENSCLSPRQINILIKLRMNNNFARFMWKYYAKELKEKLIEKNLGKLELINQNDHDGEFN